VKPHINHLPVSFNVVFIHSQNHFRAPCIIHLEAAVSAPFTTPFTVHFQTPFKTQPAKFHKVASIIEAVASSSISIHCLESPHCIAF